MLTNQIALAMKTMMETMVFDLIEALDNLVITMVRIDNMGSKGYEEPGCPDFSGENSSNRALVHCMDLLRIAYLPPTQAARGLVSFAAAFLIVVIQCC